MTRRETLLDLAARCEAVAGNPPMTWHSPEIKHAAAQGWMIKNRRTHPTIQPATPKLKEPRFLNDASAEFFVRLMASRDPIAAHALELVSTNSERNPTT